MYFSSIDWAIERGVSQEVINRLIEADKLYSLHMLIGIVAALVICVISIIIIVRILCNK
jgi:hypothetical protein